MEPVCHFKVLPLFYGALHESDTFSALCKKKFSPLSHLRVHIGLLCLSFLASGQAAHTPHSNAWRLTPQAPLSASDDAVPPKIRAARNQYFDAFTGETANSAAELDRAPFPEEVPTNESLVAVVKFINYRVVASRHLVSIYTELSCEIEQVLSDKGPPVRNGELITVIEAGGAVRLTSGKVVRRHLPPYDRYELQPQGKYLVFLSYIPDGQFYLVDKTWDLTTGKAIPNSEEDDERAKNGNSTLAGLDEQSFLREIASRLAVPSKN